MRIVHLSTSMPPVVMGGKEVVVANLVRAQKALGHDVRVVTRLRQAWAARRAGSPIAMLPLLPKPADRRDYNTGPGRRWLDAPSIAAYQLMHRFDVWHIHTVYPAAWLALPALRALNTPFVVTAHGDDVQKQVEIGYGWRTIPKHEARILRTLQVCPFMTAISDTIAQEYRAAGVPEERVVPISNGVDFSRLANGNTDRAAVRARHGVPVNAPFLITVGRNTRKKGYDLVPEIMAGIVARHPNAVWCLVGAGTEAIADQARRAGLGSCIRAIPPIRGPAGSTAAPPDDLVALLHAADVFVFPTRLETFGLVAIEAMAAGLPVVTTSAPGVADFVTDRVNALVGPVDDAAAMAEHIHQVLNDNGLRLSLLAAGHKTAQAYDWSAIASRYVQAYEWASRDGGRR